VAALAVAPALMINTHQDEYLNTALLKRQTETKYLRKKASALTGRDV